MHFFLIKSLHSKESFSGSLITHSSLPISTNMNRNRFSMFWWISYSHSDTREVMAMPWRCLICTWTTCSSFRVICAYATFFNRYTKFLFILKNEDFWGCVDSLPLYYYLIRFFFSFHEWKSLHKTCCIYHITSHQLWLHFNDHDDEANPETILSTLEWVHPRIKETFTKK